MKVSLTPELQKHAAQKVEPGLYADPSEVVREALWLLFEAEEASTRRLAQLDSAVQIGLDQADGAWLLTVKNRVNE